MTTAGSVRWQDGEPRVVAYVDILDFSNAVRELETHPEKCPKLVAALQEGFAPSEPPGTDFMQAFLSGPGHKPFDLDLQQTAFSDCAVVSARLDRQAAFAVSAVVIEYARCLLMHGHLLRGGIVKGLLAHGSVVMGPSLLTAHHIEQKAGIYPRIVVDGAVATDLLRTESKPNARATLGRGEDGLYFLDVLTTLGLRPEGRKVLQAAKRILEQRLAAPGTLDLVGKWNWFAKQYQRTCELLKLDPAERLEVPPAR